MSEARRRHRPKRLARPPGPPSPYGAFVAVDALGGGAAPLLAGFAVTLIALILQVADTLRWPDLALVLFGLASVSFLQVVQLNARARGYAVTPAQVQEWYADDFADPERQRVIAWELRHHRACWVFLVRRARVLYNCGILSLLCGIAVMLVPRARAELGVTRWIAIGVAAFAVAVELLELADQWLKRRRLFKPLRRITGWLAPADPPVAPRRYQNRLG
jgi:hypothetical protein